MVGSSLPSHNLTPKSIKFLCSYGGRILPRHSDGKLRYHGGETRVLSVHSSISFSELLVKMGEMCGSSVSLRCQLPADDLDALISITSDEDLTNLIEEYDRSSSLKIRAFLSAPKSSKKVSPPTSFSSHSKSAFGMYTGGGGLPPRCPISGGRQFKRISSKPPAYPIIVGQKVSGKIPHQFVYQYQIGQGNGCRVGRLIHNGNHWQ
ncbi:hypothetical protein SASPL_107602 [Salvia splendens]|uniref:PB1 domain-containing protein n=1 Tax=Salvia splendens TaxID=180675 RepID=A0A8X8YCQ6_SALSN|nr:uncharacterized protein LOC121793449 [Salvia splendens]KAG6429550.1 hypothetical protein SASPL_107602 [Salvia splendens]